jgi:uncharacterized protein (TIGR03492 family)
VGDIVPLLFAELSGAPYGFVGTAKSEYYVRDEAGYCPIAHLGNLVGFVYYPWERWLMSRRRCKAVFPRDKLTTETLQKWSIPAFDLGNPMMDGIAPEHPAPVFYETNAELKEMQRSLVVTLLPGSRVPKPMTIGSKLCKPRMDFWIPSRRERSCFSVRSLRL